MEKEKKSTTKVDSQLSNTISTNSFKESFINTPTITNKQITTLDTQNDTSEFHNIVLADENNTTGFRNLSVSARVIYQLGEQLIKDEFVALTELIKNAYDADATSIKIDVDTYANTKYGKGRITIEDNGNGMTRDILFNAFLRISTNFKINEKYSPVFNRRTLGEKGLGRLAIQRLGEHVEVITKPRINDNGLLDFFNISDIKYHKEHDTAFLEIDWSEFKNSNEDFGDMQVRYRFSSDPSIGYGTKLIIEGINNLSFWRVNKKDINRFRKELFGLVNPFTQNSNLRFDITLIIDSDVISNKKINEDALRIMSDINVEFELNNWNLYIKIISKSNYVDRLSAELIRRMEFRGFTKYSKFEGCAHSYKDYILDMHLDLTSEDLSIEYPYLKDIKLLEGSFNTPVNPGNFHGKMYILSGETDATREAVSKLSNNGIAFSTQAEVKAIWEAASGVKLYRDGFRIYPYGELTKEGLNDWLNFTDRSQRVKANAYKAHTVAGYINLDGITSDNVKEQTNRNGLIENEYGKNFMIIVRDILAEILARKDIYLRSWFELPEIKPDIKEIKSKDGNIIFYRELVNQKDEKELIDVKKEFSELVLNSNIDETTKNKLFNVKKNVEEIIDNEVKRVIANKQLISEKEQKINYLEKLMSLAGQGMIVETLTHELNRIEHNISDYAKDSKDELLKLQKIKDEFSNIIKKQDGILHQLVIMQQQLDHLEPTYKSNEYLIETINMRDFLDEIYIKESPMSSRAKDSGVKVSIKSDGDITINANKGVLITIFDNMFINSLYWLENSKIKRIEFNINSENRTITISDTGPGINKEREYDLFEPEKSSKPNGRGLGLYIVKELTKYLNANIYLDTTKRNSNGNLNTFILQFPL